MSFTTNSQGGEYRHKLDISEMPKHDHGLALSSAGQLQDDFNDAVSSDWTENYRVNNNSIYNNTGEDKPHNNIQPYIVTCFWKRTI